MIVLNRIMKELADRSGIQGRKTNHSAQKTMVQTLCTANISDSTIMQLSGHKNVSNLNHYNKSSLDQQQSISTLLSHCQPDCSKVTMSATNQGVHYMTKINSLQLKAFSLMLHLTTATSILQSTNQGQHLSKSSPTTSHPVPK